MFKTRIRSWGLHKKNKYHEVRAILRYHTRRKLLGKKSRFVLRGRVVDLADLERYAQRKQLSLNPDDLSSPASPLIQDLNCFTPPSTPLPFDAPVPLRNTEKFLHSFNAFLRDSLQEGLWKLGKDVMGIACIQGVEYLTSARDMFFLSIERGVRRYKLGDISQAYRQWRTAASEMQSLITFRKPSQLLGLVELVAHLAQCKGEVASLLLRYIGHLVKDYDHCDARISMLESLSRLQAEDLADLVTISNDCSRNAFSNHFQRQSFFLLDSETILMASIDAAEKASGPSLSSLMWGWETYDFEALRAARSVMEILMNAGRYEEAECITNIHVYRMNHMQYDGTVGAAFSNAYSCLTHLYLMKQDYGQAYQCTRLKVENYFRTLQHRVDLPEDFILSSYSILSFLAQDLGMGKEAASWRHKYKTLKRHTDALADRELLVLKYSTNAGQQSEYGIVSLNTQRALSIHSQASEILSWTSKEDFRKCNYHTLTYPGAT